jgi:hypothetical protein
MSGPFREPEPTDRRGTMTSTAEIQQVITESA